MASPSIENLEVSAVKRWRRIYWFIPIFRVLRIVTANNELKKVSTATLESKAAYKLLQLQEPLLNEEDALEELLPKQEDASEEPLLEQEDASKELLLNKVVTSEEDKGYGAKEDDKGDDGKTGPLEDNGYDDGEEHKLPEEKEAQTSEPSSVSSFKITELLDGNKNDNGEEAAKDDDEEEKSLEERKAQNSKVSSSPSLPSGIERNSDVFTSVPSVQAKESDHVRLLNCVEETFLQISADGAGGGDVLTGENGGQGRVFQQQHSNGQGNYQHVREQTSTSAHSGGCFPAEIRVILLRTPWRNAFLKWLLIVLNVVLEIAQAVFTQEKEQGKMHRGIYLSLSISTSCACLLMSLFEACHKAMSSRVECRRMGCCWWWLFHSQGRLFGTLALYFGIICSLVQLVVNLIAKFTKKDLIKFDPMALEFALCHLGATIIASRENIGLSREHQLMGGNPTIIASIENSRSLRVRQHIGGTPAIIASRENTSLLPIVLECNIHGDNEAEPMLIHDLNRLAYQCPWCRMESLT